MVCGSSAALAAPWRDAGDAHERLREHVVQAERRSSRSRSPPAARRARARRGRARRADPAGGDQPRGLVRGERRDRVRAHRARPLDGVAERVERARGELRHGLGGGERRVEDHDRGAHARGGRRRRRAACRCPRVISAPDSVVGTSPSRRDVATPARAAAERLGDVDHAPAAQRDEPVAADRRQQPGGERRRPGPRPTIVHRARGRDDVRRGRRRALASSAACSRARRACVDRIAAHRARSGSSARRRPSRRTHARTGSSYQEYA